MHQLSSTCHFLHRLPLAYFISLFLSQFSCPRVTASYLARRQDLFEVWLYRKTVKLKRDRETKKGPRHAQCEIQGVFSLITSGIRGHRLGRAVLGCGGLERIQESRRNTGSKCECLRKGCAAVSKRPSVARGTNLTK